MEQHRSAGGRGHKSQGTRIAQKQAGQDLVALLDLHRRGVIDDVHFAALSRGLTDGADHNAHGRPAGRLTRLAPAVIASSAFLVLAAAGASWAVMPHDHGGSARTMTLGAADVTGSAECTRKPEVPAATDRGSSNDLATSGDATCAVDVVEPAPSQPTPEQAPVQETSPGPTPSSAAVNTAASTAVPAPVEVSPEQALSGDSTSAVRPASPPPPPAAPAVEQTAPAAVAAPVPTAGPTVPQVDCSAYRYALEANRSRYQARLFNLNTEWNLAFNSGDLDRAASLSSQAQQLQSEWGLADARLSTLYPGC